MLVLSDFKFRLAHRGGAAVLVPVLNTVDGGNPMGAGAGIPNREVDVPEVSAVVVGCFLPPPNIFLAQS